MAPKRKLGNLYWSRFIVQGIMLILVGYLAWRHQYATGSALDSYCPFGAVESIWVTLTTGKFIPFVSLSNFILLGTLVVITLLAGGVFCGWLCPMGTIQDWLYRIRKKFISKTVVIPNSVDKYLRLLKYAVLLLIIVMSSRLYLMWFAEFDPFKQIFHFKIEKDSAYVIIGLFLALSLLIERFWCKYLCPLGAIIAPLSKIGLLRIGKTTSCTSCNLCQRNCNMGLQEIGEFGCNNCLECVTDCPTSKKALEVRFGSKKTGFSQSMVPLTSIVVAAVLVLGSMGMGSWTTQAASAQVALPPGSESLGDYPAVESVIFGSSYIDEVAEVYNLTPEEIYAKAGLDPKQDGHKTVKDVTEKIGIQGQVIRDAVSDLVKEKIKK